MSQVQPPRSRPSNARPATIQILRWSILNLGALVITALLFRTAIVVAVPDTEQTGLKTLLRATHIVVWPLELLSPLSVSLGSGLTIADILAILIIVVIWIAALGIIAGWEREGQRMRSVTPEKRSRP
jgi:hypothetical protein